MRAQQARPARRRSFQLQLLEPLPKPVLAAAGDAIRSAPTVEFYASGRADASLSWLTHFAGLTRLSINLAKATTFEPIGQMTDLQEVHLAATLKPVSLAFLAGLSNLTDLGIEKHAHDIEVVADLPSLEHLALSAVKTPKLDFLRQHSTLDLLRISFGSVRDFEPLSTVPNLVGLDLYRVRQLAEEQLAALSGCAVLEALGLDALPNVHHLDFLPAARGRATPAPRAGQDDWTDQPMPALLHFTTSTTSWSTARR